MSNRRLKLDARTGFVLAVCLGALSILFGTWINSPKSSLLLPMAVMGFYFLFYYWDEEIPRGQFGDAMYYLGFMLTLIALAISLYELAQKAPHVDFNQLIVKFGLALGTTILGLTARMFVAHFNSSMEDSMERTQRALGEAASNLRTHLDQATAALEAQTKVVQGVLSRVVRKTTTSIDKNLDASNTKFVAAVERLEGSLSNSAERFEAAVEKVSGLLETRTARTISEVQHAVSKSSEDLAQVLQTFSDTVRDFAMPKDFFTSRLSPAVEDLVEAIRGIGKGLGDLPEIQEGVLRHARTLSSVCAELSSQSASVKSAFLRIEELTSPTTNSVGALKELNRVLAEGMASLRSFGDELKARSRTIGSMGVQLDEELQRVRERREALARELEQYNRDVRLAHKELTAAASYVLESLRKEQ